VSVPKLDPPVASLLPTPKRQMRFLISCVGEFPRTVQFFKIRANYRLRARIGQPAPIDGPYCLSGFVKYAISRLLFWV
jgi:hypothetical protein